MLGTRCHECPGVRAPSCDRVRELRAWALSSHGASFLDRASDPSVASPSSAGFRSAFASPSALALASRIAFPWEEAAKVAVTTTP